ncbi:SDR family NAD(P)-dependent oxidoreductase [Mycobacterium sherrisii]|uniref:SDR family NAD(P)-dependent oxidoreductase n=1 Tax=Mycobacterium sherrisii TaxID=243061 RepID=UPI003974EB2F
MTAPLEGRTAVVSGAGAGLGRAEAFALALCGANVIVNDIGSQAHAVVEEITVAGGRAAAVVGDVSHWALGAELVTAALDRFGSLDIVVNNAGIIRDRMIFNMTEHDWAEVIGVHLTGHAALCQAATAHWRSESKRTGAPVYGRVINTSSEAFLLGAVAAPNYAAAKAGITALTVSTARATAKYGVTANAICPRARTQMTAGVMQPASQTTSGVDYLAPERVATFVAYLASPHAAAITGQVFIVYGDFVALMAPPRVETTFVAPTGLFSLPELETQIGSHFADRPAEAMFAAFDITTLSADALTDRS